MADFNFGDGVVASAPSTATASDNLATARENYARILAEISANPKPSYSVNGRSMPWTEYQKFLLEAIERLDSLVQVDAPFEIRTQGIE